MIGTERPTGPRPPKRGSEEQHRQKKASAGHLKPQNAADTLKWPQKTADAARQAPGLLRHGAAHGLSDCLDGFRSLSGCSGLLGVASQALTGQASGDSQSDSQHSSHFLRLHFVMMVTAPLAETVFWGI